MSCDCIYACPIDQCTTTLIVGRISPNTACYVIINDTVTGRIKRIATTSNPITGEVSIQPPAGFLSPSFKYELDIIENNSLCARIDFMVEDMQVNCVQFGVSALGNTAEEITSIIEIQQYPLPIQDEEGNNILDESFNPITS